MPTTEPLDEGTAGETIGEGARSPAVRYDALAASVKRASLTGSSFTTASAMSLRAAGDEIESLRAQAELERLKARTRAYEQDIKLRREWSSYLKWVLGGTLGFQVALAICIGLGWLHYEKYEFFVNAVVAENFVQLIGLCYIVVNYLFPKPAGAEPQPRPKEAPANEDGSSND